jgi:molybdopterin-guanine dinucleotide biosynthesis protein A
MLHWPLAALRGALDRVVVAAKPDSELPALPAGVEVWREPAQPRHPLAAIVFALQRARGAAVIVCAVDLPLVERETVRALACVPGAGVHAVVTAGDRPQPLLARYEVAALDVLAAVGSGGDVRLLDAVQALELRTLAVAEEQLLNVNDRGDAARAARILAARERFGQPNVNA